ncbi:OmpL47-type beta-barrel domain-containing protein [Amycolatopsis sp. 195334CR]|uniref:OmpL47-type beta-barrel domain-containing protein n=1 Tax=Amycolatopsis sp. 195334CR TaxID=2814588 RepID=UPI001A8E20DF|nr:chitobiase/beta-hexosaminidase C-terminal domain-containing protein [Amycolatopsis sp. 195334CR]MBN6035991.1 Ig-like domain repeat protein [Amycolatopsis sp. 195334CR]
MSRRMLAALAAALTMLGLVVMPASASSPVAAAAQTLTWTSDENVTKYTSAPTTAVAGETTIVFENSVATGNDTGMLHTLTFDTSTPGYNHDAQVNITASPSDANQGRHELTVTLTPGKYRYFCALPGHSSMQGEFVVTEGGGGEDTTPPVVTAKVTGEQNADGDYVGSAAVELSATDDNSGVDKVEYQLDGGAWTAYTAPVQVTAVGAHMVHYRATDKAGNASQEGMSSFTIVEGGGGEDTTPPVVAAKVTGNQDPDGNYVGSASVELTATDEGSGVDKVEYQLDGGAWTAYTAPVVVSTPGAHMLHHRATDKAGNTSAEGMAHFTVVEEGGGEDTTPPVVAAVIEGTQNSDGAYVGSASIKLNATDEGSGVDKVEYQLDGGAWTAYTAPVPVTALGAHTVKFRATDKAGNASAEGSSAFTIVEGSGDVEPPKTSMAVTGTQNSNWAYVDKATVTLTATDTGSGVDKIEYQLDGAAWAAYAAPVEVTAVGTHTVKYRASDKEGNVADERTGTFTVVKGGSGPGQDVCPDSDLRSTVIIGGIDSQVRNVDIGNGCTINDVIAENAEYATHTKFVRHVKAVTKELVGYGVLTSANRDRIITAAINSDIGMQTSNAV